MTMPVRKYADIEEVRLTLDDAVGVTKKVAIGKKEGWADYTLRAGRPHSKAST
jgi:hypothetical protein